MSITNGGAVRNNCTAPIPEYAKGSILKLISIPFSLTKQKSLTYAEREKTGNYAGICKS